MTYGIYDQILYMDELETSMQILNFNARIKAITKVPVNVRNPNLGCLPDKHCPVQLYTRVAKIQQKSCDRDKSCAWICIQMPKYNIEFCPFEMLYSGIRD